MPTTYTHDAFGKAVYRRLPEEIKEIIRRNKDLYRIGLHGPDLLFYHLFNAKVNQTGVKLHSSRAGRFFEDGMKKAREEQDEALLVYLLGVGCHYLLDSTCHPLVYQLDRKKVISHINLEKEFDRFLLKKHGKDPDHYYPLKYIAARESYAKTIHKAFPMISEKLILTAWKLMKRATNLMVCDDKGFRKGTGLLITRGLRIKPAEELMEHFMGKQEMEGSKEPVLRLYQKYLEALLEAPEKIQELYQLFQEDKNLSDRWNRTYNG